MGKLVVFWSPYQGHGKTTSSLCAVVCCLKMQYPDLNAAISYTQGGSCVLQQKLCTADMGLGQNEKYENLGVDALNLYIRQKELSEEIIVRSGIPLPMKELYLYPNMQSRGSEDMLVRNILTEQIRRVFDVVFLDVESGNRKMASLYMQDADFKIIALPQDPVYVERFVRDEEELLEQKNCGVILGGALVNSKYDIRYYKKMLGSKFGDKLLGVIYQNVGFFEAMSAGKTLDFFRRNQLVQKKEENYEFVFQAKKAAENIGKKIIVA